jgi:hypothetical protein
MGGPPVKSVTGWRGAWKQIPRLTSTNLGKPYFKQLNPLDSNTSNFYTIMYIANKSEKFNEKFLRKGNSAGLFGICLLTSGKQCVSAKHRHREVVDR